MRRPLRFSALALAALLAASALAPGWAPLAFDGPARAQSAPEAAPDAEAEPEAGAEGDGAQEGAAVVREGDFTVARLEALIRAADPDARTLQEGRSWGLTVESVQAVVISDPANNRMRIVVRIAPAEALNETLLSRMLSANFDTALDARYAIARGALWATYIHPLAELHDRQFLSALGQTVNLALSFGDSFSSGGLSFSGGDAADRSRRALIEELQKRGEDI